jgi:hypothetical protein
LLAQDFNIPIFKALTVNIIYEEKGYNVFGWDIYADRNWFSEQNKFRIS